MKPLTAVYLVLTLVPVTLSQVNQPNCESLVLQRVSARIQEQQPQKGDRYRRPPMVAFEVQEDGYVRGVRLVRRSGIKELDRALVTAASNWRYLARPGCKTLKVPLAAGPISDEIAAVKVAEPELNRIYGAGHMEKEKPLDARLSGEMWIVTGTLRCTDGNGRSTPWCAGGVATAHLAKSDGRVLVIFHGR